MFIKSSFMALLLLLALSFSAHAQEGDSAPTSNTPICKTVGNATGCLNSNQTGTVDLNNDGSIDWVYRFVSDGICPPTTRATSFLSPSSGPFPTHNFLDSGFSSGELFDSLGLGQSYCIYLPGMAPEVAPTAQTLPSEQDTNACLEGGSMAGKCDSNWAWSCGWYLAKWEEAGGWRNRNNTLLPDWCSSLLPPEPPAPEPIVAAPSTTGGQPSGPTFPSAGCMFHFGTGIRLYYINFNGGYAVGGANVQLYSDPACSVTSIVALVNVVYAPPPWDANDLCMSAYGTSVHLGPQGDNSYICH